jgi:hypothetical protein
MNIIWRFYSDPTHVWRWQQISADRTVVSESNRAYKNYEGCLADATEKGYVFQAPQPKSNKGRVRVR